MNEIESINLWLAGAILLGGTVRIAACFIKMVANPDDYESNKARIKNTVVFIVLALTVQSVVGMVQHYFPS